MNKLLKDLYDCFYTPPELAATQREIEECHRALIEALADLDKELYVVCEQDMYGCDPAYPAPNAAKVREYLASLGLGLA